MTRPKRQPITYSDSLRHAGRSVTVTLPRWAWEYLMTVALDAKLWATFDPIRKARYAAPDADTLAVTAADAEFADLADAAARVGRERSAGLLRAALTAACDEKKRKPKPGAETPAETMRRLHADGVLEADEIETAKRRGWL
jgi:hypothetical protein